VARPVAPPAAPKVVDAPRSNPFASQAEGAGPNPTQLSALTNIASNKSIPQHALIALAGVLDDSGSPKQTFEELTRTEAIQVIQASRL
jgi:hypothetical protein